MTDKLKNYVSKNAFLAMIGLVIAMSVAVYVRHEKNSERAVITNYRISQLEDENKALQKKLYVLERSLVTLQHSLDADGDIPSLEGEENE
jgi:hypothetical protein|tara:strand:+ start:141 stop:410 length:270 start_codon:yes stop_codon:yes gene_type:complete